MRKTFWFSSQLTDVKSSTPQNGLPAGKLHSVLLILVVRSVEGPGVVVLILALHADVVGRGADAEMDSQGRSLKVESLARGVRGIPLFPHSSALKDLQVKKKRVKKFLI